VTVHPDDSWPEPRANDYFLGHESARAGLAKAFASGRPAQAWLFSGPKGVGKATLAFRVARYVLSHPPSNPGTSQTGEGQEKGEGVDVDFYTDPGSPVFRRAASGGHADLHVLEPQLDPKRGVRKTEITVDDVRGAISFVNRSSAEGGWRVLIIDSAEAMNVNAANALLKNLEEPPKGVLVFLIAHMAGALPATIRSRCRFIHLAPLDTRELTALISRYRPNVGETEAVLAAQLARGSIGQALELCHEDTRQLVDHVSAAFRSLPRFDLNRVSSLGETASANTDAFLLIQNVVQSWLMSILRSAHGINAALASYQDRDTVFRLSQGASLDRWMALWENSAQLLARTDRAKMDRKQIIINIFLQLEHELQR